MKYLVAILAIILTIGLNIEATANEPEAACSAQNTAKCPPAADSHAASDKHKDQAAEMNSLFPPLERNSKLTARPAAVELTAPKFLAKVSGEAKLEWKAAKGANSYHIQVATDPNFKWLVAQEQMLKITSFSFTKTESGKKYYWRVAAFNSDNDAMYTKSNFTSSVFVAK